MKKKFSLLSMVSLCIVMFLSITAPALSGEDTVIPVIRQAMEDQEAAVAVDGNLSEGAFQVKVTARIYDATPNIYSILLVGPNLGRLSPSAAKSLYATGEEEAPYETTTRGGLIDFGSKTKEKNLQGRVVRKLAKFTISPEQILPGKEYELWVRVESSASRGRISTYRFNLENFPELVNSFFTPPNKSAIINP